MHIKHLYVLAFAAAAGCSGGGDPISPPPPPPDTSLTAKLVNPSKDVTVTSATMNVSATVSVSPSMTATLTIVVNDSVINGSSATITLRPGANQVCAVAVAGTRQSKDCHTVTYTAPAMDFHVPCKLVAAHETSEALLVPAHITFTKKDGTSASRTVGTDGDCSVDMPTPAVDSVRVVVDTTGISGVYHPMIVASAPTSGMVLIMIPRHFGGQNIDLNLAYIAGGDGLSFYPRHKVTGNQYFFMVESFPSSDLPKPIGFATKPEVISAASQDTIWAAIHQLEGLLGWKFSRPLNPGEQPDPNNLIGFAKDSTISASDPNELATAGPFWNGSKYYSGLATFKNESAIGSINTMHEIIHILGFDHGCGWPSIMTQLCSNSSPTSVPSAKDIAYINQMYRARALERKYGTHFSIAESDIGEEVLIMGLPEKQRSMTP